MSPAGSTSGAPERRIGALELAVVVCVACVLATVMHWPIPLHLGRDVARDLGDPLVQAWQVAWGGHALLHQPLDYFQANTFWPLRNSLAFSEALAGYAPAGALGSGTEAAIVRYNLLFLFSYALAFVGAYLLARELGAGRVGAAVAGAAFAYAPWRLEQDGHLHVLSSGGIPLSLFLLVRGYRRGKPATVLAGWLVATWQVALGFTLGLQLAYLLGVLGLIALGVWLRRGRPNLPRPVVVATAAGLLIFVSSAALLARPYMEVLDDHPDAERRPAQVEGLSGPPQQFLAAPAQNLVWGEATAEIRDTLSSVPEQTLFPGLVILGLALAGVGSQVYERRVRLGLAIGVLVAAVLSLGFHDPASFLYPYRWLYEAGPGWKGIRVPGRLMTLASLGLALLAAAGAARMLRAAGDRRPSGAEFAGTRAYALGLALVLAVLVEGSGFGLGRSGTLLAAPAHPVVPKSPSAYGEGSTPRLHLPLTVPANRRYVLWSTDGFPAIVNGRGSFVPNSFERLAAEMESFPDRSTVARLRSAGIRSVVLHSDLAPSTPWERAAMRPVEHLGVRREKRGRLVVYRLSG